MSLLARRYNHLTQIQAGDQLGGHVIILVRVVRGDQLGVHVIILA